MQFLKNLAELCIALHSPTITIKISSLPKIIPAISINNTALPVPGPVSPIDRPTVPRDEANSNIASSSEQWQASVSAIVPHMYINR